MRSRAGLGMLPEPLRVLSSFPLFPGGGNVLVEAFVDRFGGVAVLETVCGCATGVRTGVVCAMIDGVEVVVVSTSVVVFIGVVVDVD